MGIDRYVYAANDTTWVDTFMERIEKQSKGYNAVSLSNYDATGVCVITDGSAFEVAGSMYLCTADTSITASCATGVCYIMATGATATASVAWSTTAPTWRDDYQGYYASAASAVRALGGTYFDGASYIGKWVYNTEHAVIQTDGTSGLRWKELEIGDWNMDTGETKDVAHGLPKTSIRSVSAYIRMDIGGTKEDRMLCGDDGGWIRIDEGGNITLGRLTGGYFDDADYNATSYNRGWVIVWYGAGA